ncbi:MAG: thiamine-phosphate pyrophosphorylase [Planctomycetota bacterium]|nr:MAG: thiamine-phosphate pyrophosphorylase [Planctomycetota bacterium]
MSDTGLTPGAMRALESAGRIAWSAGASSAEPVHLLWALSLDETRASELLGQCGINVELLATHFPGSSNSSDSPSEPAPVPIPLSQLLSNVIRAARDLAMQLGADDAAGTEHLLNALATVDPAIAEFFRVVGFNSLELHERLQQSSVAAKPIAPEFDIRWTEPTESNHTDTLRTLDAAANRAREGLRVIEDFVRFSLDDAHLSRLLKELRHELTERLSDLDRLSRRRVNKPDCCRSTSLSRIAAASKRPFARSTSFPNCCSATRRMRRSAKNPRTRRSPARDWPTRICRRISNKCATGSTRSRRR